MPGILKNSDSEIFTSEGEMQRILFEKKLIEIIFEITKIVQIDRKTILMIDDDWFIFTPDCL